MRFLPLLEQSWLIVQAGLGCLQQALSLLAQWQVQGGQFVMAVNLSTITSFVSDTVKINRCFLRDMDISSSDLSIVRKVIEMAHALGVFAVAEGGRNV